MPTNNTRKTNSTDSTSLPFNSDLMKGGENAFFAMAHIQSAMLYSMAKYNLEALRFLQMRLEKDVDLAKQMNACKSFTELQEATSDFCKTAFDEYSKEAGTLANLATGLASETVETVQKETAKASHPNQVN